MSVNINVKNVPKSNEEKWNDIKTGDFLILDGIPEHPIQAGLYRVFIMTAPEPPHLQNVFIVPMFDSPFGENMFPYLLTDLPYPKILKTVDKVNIEIECS